MAATKYTYSIAEDTLNGAVAASKLATEIGASAIVTAFDHISTSGDVLDIWFKDALSAGDETILDGVVAAHDGINTSSNLQDLANQKIIDEPVDDAKTPITRPGACKPGRKYEARYFTFKSSDLDSLVCKKVDNSTSWTDIGLKLFDAVGDEITLEANEGNAVRTEITFGGAVTYEVIGGHLWVPETLAGAADDDWKVWVTGAPGIPVVGDVPFLTGGMMLKWYKNKVFDMDGRSAKQLVYVEAAPAANQLKFTFRHPAGAVTEFMGMLEVFVD